MQHKPKASFLGRFQYNLEDEHDSGIVITCCPKTPFRVNPDQSRVVKDLFVTYRNGRWNLVDPLFYLNAAHVNGLFRAELYECMDSEGNDFLLISTYPLTCSVTSWRDSVLDVIDSARGNWVTMKKGVNQYDFQIVSNIKHKPRWSSCSMDDFVAEAFHENVFYYEESVLVAVK